MTMHGATPTHPSARARRSPGPSLSLQPPSIELSTFASRLCGGFITRNLPQKGELKMTEEGAGVGVGGGSMPRMMICGNSVNT